MRLSQEELTANIDDDFKAVVAKLQNTFNLIAKSLPHGCATHTYGAVAKGEARCIVPADFPANGTLVFGKSFPIVLRHSRRATTPTIALGTANRSPSCIRIPLATSPDHLRFRSGARDDSAAAEQLG
jgi:hypothetical protein